MNNTLEKIKNTFSRKIIHKKDTVNPHGNWKFILRIFFIIVSCLILFTFYILYQIKNEQIFQVTPKSVTPPSPIKQNLLKSITESFNKKSEKTIQLKTSPVTHSDPSI